uniref:PGG domain-containing protein n=1 Tax=Davidia involucrata TaxID=16924 RepID=A0A5B6YR97_DAVIN
MISNTIALSRFGRSLSIQSCFPERKSAANSCCKSPEWDDTSLSVECSDDDISLKDVICPGISDHGICASSFGTTSSTVLNYTLQRQFSCPIVTFSDVRSPNHHLPQLISSSIDFPEVEGDDAHMGLNPSLWPISDSAHEICGTDAELTTGAIDSATFSRTVMPEIGAVSGNISRNIFTAYVPLHLAAFRGDWDAAKRLLDLDPQAVRAKITRGLETALHVAAGARHTMFVQELVELMTPDDLALQNKVGNTALCFAAASGITKIAQAMVNKNKRLPFIRGSKGATPLCMAALLGHKDMVWYLYSLTENDLTEEDRIELLVAAITADLFGVALHLIQRHPQLALARDGNGDTALHVLARKPSAFPSGSQLGVWQRCIYSCLYVEQSSNYCSSSIRHNCPSCSIVNGKSTLKVLIWNVIKHLVPGIKTIHDTKLMHIQALELVKKLWKQILLLDDSEIGELLRSPSRLLFTAAELGIVEFLTMLIQSYPDLIWKVDDNSRSIFHIAVAHRQEKIFNLIYEIGAHMDLIAAYKDGNNNNILHLAGKLAPADRLEIDSGAALQLRRELHWFEAVEKIVQPSYREMKNSEGRTPRTLFKEEHKGLVREGEKWMKDTASSCMVVATLIATVMFAAAFTVPGGNDNDTGRPIFLRDRSFMVFAISDALALFSSASSILIFLSILTSRYAQGDFLHSLPSRLIIGLTTLFISIATMMIAFSATLFIVLGHEFAWIAIPIAAVACVPVTLFALLQFPLFADIISHIYRSSIFFHPSSHLLC